MWSNFTSSLKEFTTEVIANNLKEEDEIQQTSELMSEEEQKKLLQEVHELKMQLEEKDVLLSKMNQFLMEKDEEVRVKQTSIDQLTRQNLEFSNQITNLSLVVPKQSIVDVNPEIPVTNDVSKDHIALIDNILKLLKSENLSHELNEKLNFFEKTVHASWKDLQKVMSQNDVKFNQSVQEFENVVKQIQLVTSTDSLVSAINKIKQYIADLDVFTENSKRLNEKVNLLEKEKIEMERSVIGVAKTLFGATAGTYQEFYGILVKVAEKFSFYEKTLLCLHELMKNPKLKDLQLNPEIQCDRDVIHQWIQNMTQVSQLGEANVKLSKSVQVLSDEKVNFGKTFQEKLKELVTKISHLESDLSEKEQDLQEKIILIDRLNVQVNELNYRLKETQMNSGDSLSVFKQKMEEYKQETQRITTILAEKKEELATQSEKYEIDIFSKNKQVEELKHQAKNQMEKIVGLEREILLLSNEIAEKTKNLYDTEKSLISLESALEQVQISSELEMEKMRSSQKEAQKQSDLIQKQLEQVNLELGQMEEKRRLDYEEKVNSMNIAVSDATEKANFYLASLQDAISRVNDPNLIDRRILNKILLRFLQEKEDHLVPLLERMLGLNDVEKERFLSSTQVSSGWFGMGGSSSSGSGRSLSELWVDFLEKETK